MLCILKRSLYAAKEYIYIYIYIYIYTRVYYVYHLCVKYKYIDSTNDFVYF